MLYSSISELRALAKISQTKNTHSYDILKNKMLIWKKKRLFLYDVNCHVLYVRPDLSEEFIYCHHVAFNGNVIVLHANNNLADPFF